MHVHRPAQQLINLLAAHDISQPVLRDWWIASCFAAALYSLRKQRRSQSESKSSLAVHSSSEKQQQKGIPLWTTFVSLLFADGKPPKTAGFGVGLKAFRHAVLSNKSIFRSIMEMRFISATNTRSIRWRSSLIALESSFGCKQLLKLSKFHSQVNSWKFHCRYFCYSTSLFVALFWALQMECLAVLLLTQAHWLN